MKKLFIVFVLLLIVLGCVMPLKKTLAQEPNVFDTRTLEQETPVPRFELRLGGRERLYPITQGSISPATGTLFNTDAVAWLDTYMNSVHEYYIVEMNYRLNELRTEARFRITSAELRLATLTETHEITEITLRDNLETCNQNLRVALTGENTESNSRRRLLRNQKRKFIFITIGTALGTAITSSYITYAVIRN